MRKILLLVVAIATLTGCFDSSGGDPDIEDVGTYVNDVDKELSLTLYKGGQIFREYTIPAKEEVISKNNKVVFDTSGDPFLVIDSLYGVWGGEREFLWREEARQTFLSTWRYRTYIKEQYISVYTFVFTRAMYDAATPIEQ